MSTGSLSSSAFHRPILHVLGDGTTYRLSDSVPFSRLLSRVVPLAYLPHPDACSYWERQWLLSWEAVDAPQVRVNGDILAFYSEMDSLTESANETLVSAALEDMEQANLVRRVSADRWALTRASLAESVGLRRLYAADSVTHAWISAVITPTYRRSLVAHLNSRCPRSAAFNEIDDIINRFFSNLLNRDGLASHLAEGSPPTPSDIRGWLYRSALSMFRDEGRDALTRAFKGCLTEKDLRNAADNTASHTDVVARSMPSDTAGIYLAVDDEGQTVVTPGGGGSAPLMDVLGGDLQDDIITQMDHSRIFDLLDVAIRREKSGASERFSQILQLLRSGQSIGAISTHMGVTRTRAASLLSDFWSAVRDAVSTSEGAVRILNAVRDEPYSTLEDIEEMVGEEIDTILIDALVQAGRLSREKGGTFLITKAGETALDSKSHFGIEIAL